MLQQQCHNVCVALLRRLVQRGVAQLQGRTEGAAISSGSLLPQKCPRASHCASRLEHEGSSLLSGVSKGLCRTQHLPRTVARLQQLPAMETGGLGAMSGQNWKQGGRLSLPHQPACCCPVQKGPWSTGHLCTLVLALTPAWCCSKNFTSLMFP